MPFDMQAAMDGLFLLLGVVGTLYYLNQGAVALGEGLPTVWAVVFLECVGLAFYHFAKAARPDPEPRMTPGDKLEIKTVGRSWMWR